jgi:capsular exopolysaccharide synthesis family protein
MRARRAEEPVFTVWLDIFWKHKWLVLIFAGLVIASTAVYTRSQVKIYRASSQIVIDLAAPQYMSRGSTEVVQLGTGNSWSTLEYFETQYRIIRSRKVAARVVETLGLAHDLDFLGISQIEDPDLRKRKLERADPVAKLVGRISVEPVKNSHVVMVRIEDHDPVRAARLADAVVEAYAEQNVNRKVSAAREAMQWLRAQREALGLKQVAAEKALVEFKSANGILSASLADRQNLLGSDLQDARRQLRTLRRENAALKSQNEQIDRLSTDEAMRSVPDVMGNGLIQQLKQQRVELQNERDELLKRYLDKHPDVRLADGKIRRVDRVLAAEVAGIAQSIKRAYGAAQKVESELAAEVRSLESKAREMNAQELEYRRLEQAAASNKQLYSELQIRWKEAEMQADSRANNVRIMDRALVPSMPVRPRLMVNLAVALVLALVGGLGLAFLVEQLDRSVKNQDQIESDFGLTFLGVIPSIKSSKGKGMPAGNPDRYIIDNPNSTAAECVRTIRTNLLFMSPDRQMRSMLVTSAGPREGKTYTSVNIGATMAMSGSRVLLVDSDLRRPRVHKVFDMTNDRGWTNLLVDPEAEVEKVAQHSGIPGLDILCSGPLPPNPAELLGSKGFKRGLDKLLEVYDQVIFDSPPVVAVTDAQIIGRQLDGTVLVVRAGQTTHDMLAKAVRLLTDVKVNMFGALLNNLDVSRRGYGQYYYRYYRQDGAYGADATEQS